MHARMYYKELAIDGHMHACMPIIIGPFPCSKLLCRL